MRISWTSSSGFISTEWSSLAWAILPLFPTNFPLIILKRYSASLYYQNRGLDHLFPGDVCLCHCTVVPHPWPPIQQHWWPRSGLHLEEAWQRGQGEDFIEKEQDKLCQNSLLRIFRTMEKINFSILQEYSYSTANMFTAVICALFFPDKFTITVFILFSMGFLFAGIYCYEKKTFSVPVDSNSCPSAKEKGVKWSRHILMFYLFISRCKIKTHKVLRWFNFYKKLKLCNLW